MSLAFSIISADQLENDADPPIEWLWEGAPLPEWSRC